MSKVPKVSTEEFEKQTTQLYADIGRIVVNAEHLNLAMTWCCSVILEIQGVDQKYCNTIFAGMNIENMRRMWTAMMKLHYRDDARDIKMIDHLDNRIDNVNSRRNKVIHKIWWIGWGNKESVQHLCDGTQLVRGLG